jgi:RNA polymerase sigma-70 factor (ECF subfamily)
MGGEGNVMAVEEAACAGGRTRTERVGEVWFDAFDRLVKEHQGRIYRILLALLRDADAAETLTQECFLRAFERRSSFRGEANVGTWLVRIALNLARDHARSRRLAFWRQLMRDGRRGDPVAIAGHVSDPGPLPERTLLARERLTAVWGRVDRLPRGQRTCFLLRFVEEMPVEKIAQTMDVEVGTVKSHLARAVGAVRRHLTEWDGPCEDT